MYTLRTLGACHHGRVWLPTAAVPSSHRVCDAEDRGRRCRAIRILARLRRDSCSVVGRGGIGRPTWRYSFLTACVPTVSGAQKAGLHALQHVCARCAVKPGSTTLRVAATGAIVWYTPIVTWLQEIWQKEGEVVGGRAGLCVRSRSQRFAQCKRNAMEDRLLLWAIAPFLCYCSYCKKQWEEGQL